MPRLARVPHSSRRSRGVRASILFAASFLAGCLAVPAAITPQTAAGGDPFAGLSAAGATKTVVNADGTKTFEFQGTTVQHADAVLTSAGETAPLIRHGFTVDSRVGFAEVGIRYDESRGQTVIAYLRDPWGRIQCETGIVLPHACTAPIPLNTTQPATWFVEAEDGPANGSLPAYTGGLPFTVNLTLHPPSHITVGDPRAGTDPAATFRVSDTGRPGSEDAIGVLGDGAIFAQEDVNTMVSKDDGQTWKDVAPATTGTVTLDPMLAADPTRNLVYVDQLTVACSILAWTKDEGQTWTSNPAACGLPHDDHEKLAIGPSPIPGSPLPAVYYSFSSFAQGAFVSHSYDGGLTWVPAPVVGVTDSVSYAGDTGPIAADDKGNVYVGFYNCDRGGSIRLGVSHDYGRTFKTVLASPQPGQCVDSDPGISVDSAGTLYLAYWRSDGVYYVFSTDHGETFSTPIRVSPPTEKSFTMAAAVAGDAGRLAIAYRATSDSSKGPDMADGWSAWYMYVAFVKNGSTPKPSVEVAFVNGNGMPDQRGQICMTGIACSGGSRDLLDFIGIAVGPDGRVYVAYSSACKTGCPTPADSRKVWGPVAVEATGPRLFESRAPWAGHAAETASSFADAVRTQGPLTPTTGSADLSAKS
jgi:hypothetical protein